MNRRERGIGVTIADAERKNRAGKERSDQKRKERHPDRDLHAEWSAAVRLAFGEAVRVPEWHGEDREHARRLVRDLGLERATDVVRHYIWTWKARRTANQEAEGVMPFMRSCWVLRERLMAEIDGLTKVPRTREEWMALREWNPEDAKASPKVGW